MDKKYLFFVAALALVLLSTRNFAVAQDSASQPTRQDTAPKGFANGGNFQAPSDEDIQLLRKRLTLSKEADRRGQQEPDGRGGRKVLARLRPIHCRPGQDQRRECCAD